MYFMYIRFAAQGVFPRSLSIWRTILKDIMRITVSEPVP